MGPGPSGGFRGRLSLVYGGNILGHFTTWLGGPGMALQFLSSFREKCPLFLGSGWFSRNGFCPPPIWLSFDMFVGITPAQRSVRGFSGHVGVSLF